ncbi:hypothetical protein E3N88_06145 [Mikania micrantha]|uniref:FYVE-type domain-containing protein n=1 Tax=Mikania micrantha TaxID=192012 RepID=A0A5N6PQV4_9ASTR|nr:hypothetical protein E3N88_06145 [Mikania micrantha]
MVDTSEQKVACSSLANVDMVKNDYFIDDYNDPVWTVPEDSTNFHQAIRHSRAYDLSLESEDFLDGDYDGFGDDHVNSVQPEVNLKNVFSGIFAIVTGRNKDTSEKTPVPGSNVEFLGLGKNGDTYLHRTLLSTFPCNAPFTALTRGRHHCRFRGGIFCRACSKGRCLLPIKFRERNPQRVCDTCYDMLDPLQGVLINTISNAVQVTKHVVMDWTCTRGWLNLPVGLSLEHEIYKSSNTLRNNCQVAKVGMLLTYKLGTGLVVARREDGSWSAPSAIVSAGLGWGPQAQPGAAFRMHFSLGAGRSAAAGPVGRVLEADLRAGDKGSGMCYTYSCSKGAFIGVSLEGNIVATRMDTNLHFYGDPYLTTADILLGIVNKPKAAEPMYAAL